MKRAILEDAGAARAEELEREERRLSRAEAIIGYAFRDRAVLLSALTHRSYLNENATAVHHNEQLEFQGDAVLSLVTVDALLAATPGSSEGALTVRRAAYVSEEALAAAALERGLPNLLRTGLSAEQVTPSTRADLVEALLGAVYRDGGLDAARAAARMLLGDPPLRPPPPGVRSAKSTLQETLQRLFGETPGYEVERGDGPNHAPTFKARCVFRGNELGAGVGPTKQAATESAAQEAVAALGPDSAVRARFGTPPA